MTRDELLARLAGLRQARVGQVRVPHKPLLLLWLFGQFAATGSSAASYQQAEEPVSQLINDFGPPVASPAAARQRAAMPSVHLERDLWDLRALHHALFDPFSGRRLSIRSLTRSKLFTKKCFRVSLSGFLLADDPGAGKTTYLTSQREKLGLTEDDLRARRPPAPARTRRRRSS